MACSLCQKKYSKTPPLRSAFHKNSLIRSDVTTYSLKSRVCIPWYKKHFHIPNSNQIVKKAFLKYELLRKDLIV